MKKLIVAFSLAFFAISVQAAQVSVKYQKGLRNHASFMKSNLEQMNKSFNGKIELEVFCSYGKVKYTSISRSAGGGDSKYIPDSMYKRFGNPCK